MPLPEPEQGLVIRYSYLWLREHRQGQEEGVKDRPCAVVLVTTAADGETIVTVLPVTHVPPATAEEAIEIPPQTRKRLNLDDERSWIVLTEANRFAWPGPDLRPIKRGQPASVVYGYLPYQFMETVRTRFVALLKSRRAGMIPRTE